MIVQSTKRPGEIHIEAVKEGWDGPELTPAKLVDHDEGGGTKAGGVIKAGTEGLETRD